MSTANKTAIVVAVLAVGAACYEANEARGTRAAVASFNKDRDALSRQVKELSQRVAEASRREAAPPPEAGPPAPAQELPPPPAAALPVPGVTPKAPAGWSKNGSKPGAYEVGVDQNQGLGGLPSAYVKSTEASVDGFGGMMQMSSADDLIGKRVRLSAWVKTADANDGGGHLWFRVDGKPNSAPLQFDNMDSRPLKGSTDWQQVSVVLDVPPESTALAYGFFVAGTGQMWTSNAKMEEVGPEVPSTNMIANAAANKPRGLPKAPVNLNFQ